MLKNKLKKTPIALKILSISLAVFLVLVIMIIFESNEPPSKNSEINPPERDIKHDIDPGQITEFNLIIEKLGINTSVVPNVDGGNKKIYSEVLANGIAHYKNTGLPHSGSNIVIFGHSSTTFGISKYSKIFAKLNELNIDDEIKINFNQKEYIYKVSEKKIITSDNVSVLLPTARERVTLLTCWPVGTAKKRFVVIAEPSN